MYYDCQNNNYNIEWFCTDILLLKLYNIVIKNDKMIFHNVKTVFILNHTNGRNILSSCHIMYAILRCQTNCTLVLCMLRKLGKDTPVTQCVSSLYVRGHLVRTKTRWIAIQKYIWRLFLRWCVSILVLRRCT